MKASAWTRPMLMTSLLCLSATAQGAAQGTAQPAAPPAGAAEASEASEEGVLVGVLTREQIEAAHPDWVQSEVAAAPEAEASKALAAVPPGAEVTVFLGTWCDDSKREVPRLWRALDQAAAQGGADLPFRVNYVGVDRQKQEPAAPIANYEIEFVPTFIVSREGREVGRIVEQSPHGVEADLLALLTGKAKGVLSASQPGDAGPPSR